MRDDVRSNIPGRRGRPPLETGQPSIPTSTAFPASTYDAIDALARAQGVEIAVMVRRLVGLGLKHFSTEKLPASTT